MIQILARTTLLTLALVGFISVFSCNNVDNTISADGGPGTISANKEALFTFNAYMAVVQNVTFPNGEGGEGVVLFDDSCEFTHQFDVCSTPLGFVTLDQCAGYPYLGCTCTFQVLETACCTTNQFSSMEAHFQIFDESDALIYDGTIPLPQGDKCISINTNTVNLSYSTGYSYRMCFCNKSDHCPSSEGLRNSQ